MSGNLTSAQISTIRAAEADLLPQCSTLLASLVQTDTTNPPGRHYPECAQFIGNTLAAFGYEFEYIEVPPAQLPNPAPAGEGLPRVNVIGRLSGSQGPGVKTLHINGHFDVVPIGTSSNWKYPPFGGEIHNGRMFGRGTADVKGGIAAQIFGVEAIKKAGLKLNGTIEQSGILDEDTTGNRNAVMGFLVHNEYISADKIDAIVITELLSTTNVCCGHRGTIWGTITFRGRSSHGSMPGLGINALHHACNFVHLATTTRCPRLASRVDESVIPHEARAASLAFTVVNAGTNINSVPDMAVVSFDRRLVPGKTLAAALQEIMDVVVNMEGIAGGEGLDFEYKEDYAMEATSVDPNQPISLICQDAIQVVMGKQAGIVTFPGSDDQRFPVHFPKPSLQSTIVYGPGYISEAHISDKRIDIEKELEAGIEVMALAFATFFGVEEA